MQIDLPDVVAEVRAAFDRYERALVSNDVDTLDALFRDDPRTIRFGGTENLFGYGEIRAFRAARSPAGLARSLSKTVITTYGRDVGMASIPPITMRTASVSPKARVMPRMTAVMSEGMALLSTTCQMVCQRV